MKILIILVSLIVLLGCNDDYEGPIPTSDNIGVSGDIGEHLLELSAELNKLEQKLREEQEKNNKKAYDKTLEFVSRECAEINHWIIPKLEEELPQPVKVELSEENSKLIEYCERLIKDHNLYKEYEDGNLVIYPPGHTPSTYYQTWSQIWYYKPIRPEGVLYPPECNYKQPQEEGE